MSETLVLERQHRLAPIPSIEPPASSHSEEMDNNAREDTKKLEQFSAMLNSCHQFGIKLLSELYFGQELDGLPESLKALADAIADTDNTDIPYLWKYMS